MDMNIYKNFFDINPLIGIFLIYIKNNIIIMFLLISLIISLYILLSFIFKYLNKKDDEKKPNKQPGKSKGKSNKSDEESGSGSGSESDKSGESDRPNRSNGVRGRRLRVREVRDAKGRLIGYIVVTE
jgi:hypothetical protein